MHGMLFAAGAILLQFETPRIVLAILGARVIPFLALGASQSNDDAIFLLCHGCSLSGVMSDE
jgi:hypothetical protein